MSESGQAWREWFDAVGDAASVGVVNATATLVIAEREIFACKLLAACEALIKQYDAPGGPAITEQVNAMREVITTVKGEQ